MKDLLKNLKNADTNFITIVENISNVFIREKLYKFLKDLFKLRYMSYEIIKEKYTAYPHKKQKEIHKQLIEYFTKEYIDIEKEKVYLLSKEKLKKLVYHEKSILEIYGQSECKLQLIWNNEDSCYSECVSIKQGNIRHILNTHFIHMSITIDISKNAIYLNINNNNEYTIVSKMNEDLYTLIINAIEEINKKEEYIEFVFLDE